MKIERASDIPYYLRNVAGGSPGHHSYHSLLRTRRQDNSSANGHIRDVVVPEDHGLVEEMLAKKLTGTSSPPYTLRLLSKEGNRYEVEVSSRLLY